MTSRVRFLLACAVLTILARESIVSTGASPGPGKIRQAAADARPVDLRPTVHPPVPSEPGRLWFVPAESWRPSAAEGGAALRSLTEASRLIAKAEFARAITVLAVPALASTALADHAAYLRGVAEEGLARHEQARRIFGGLRAKKPEGALLELATMREAESAEAMGDPQAAVALYDALGALKPADQDEALAHLAHAAQAAGDRPRAMAAYERLYYEFPLSDQVSLIPTDLGPSGMGPVAAGTARFKAELARANALFGSRRFAQAREGFALLRPHASGDEEELYALRVAECDANLRRFQNARDALRPLAASGSQRPEALFYLATATRGAGDADEYVRLVRRLVEQYPASPWAEDALNNLASHYIIANDDETADEVFRESLTRYPAGRFAARAGWKVGWWAFKHGRYDEAARAFEQTASAFPRGDYRPGCLYWSGKARERSNDIAAALDRYRVAVIDYANTYYGRLAVSALQARKADVPRPSAGTGRSSDGQPLLSRGGAVPSEPIIRLLIGLGLYDLALDEVEYAERTWGSSAPLMATRAYLLNRKGDLRPGINVMKQAYPQFMTAGGEKLPAEILKVIYPIDYWPIIRQYSNAHGLDPYLVAALVAQESTFDPAAKSSANAIGMMQIVPATGRRYAAKIGIPAFSTRKLTVPEINVRIGTAYFADLVRRFGGAHFALAGYNAGEYRVARWMAERPDLARDEFIDDIPFPETQNYIKRILGTAEDYRRLYAGAAAKDPASVHGEAAPPGAARIDRR